MDRKQALRMLLALAVAGAATALAAELGAPLAAALIALLGGVCALALAPGGERTAPPPPPSDAEGPALPAIGALIDTVKEPLLIVRDRHVLAANAAAKLLLGAHIDGVDVRLAIRHPAAAELLAGTGEAAPDEVELVGLGEPARQWTMQVAPLADGAQLVRLADQGPARAAEQMRVDFVANASHELRTPLATLLGFLETLEDESAASDPKTRARFLKIMSDEAKRMRSLVEDLLSLSRIEAERFATPRDPVPLLPLTEEVRAGLAPLAEAHGAELIVAADTQDPIVAGDRSQLAQMLSNLLVNALKYGRPGTPVRIEIADAGEMVRIRVIDQGEGIAAEHLPRLTERFYRVDAGRSRAAGGTGLGLAIVKHVVLRHRGRLDIVSILGEGTMVEVCLPRAAEKDAVTEMSSR